MTLDYLSRMHIFLLFGGRPRQRPRHFRGLPWVLPRATVETRGFPRQGPRLMARPRQILRLWPRHVPRFCPWQTPSYQPWQPTEVRGNCHGNFRGRQTTAVRGHPRPLPRQSSDTWQLPRKAAAITTAISMAIRGHPRPLPRQSSDTRQLPRKSAAIATAVSADVKPQQLPR